jgi:YidC/Oxa1 family membrane protein insertase
MRQEAHAPAPEPAPPAGAPPVVTPGGEPVPPPAPTTAQPPSPISYTLAEVPADQQVQAFEPIGRLDPAPGNPFEMEVRFHPAGAGIESIRLAHSFESVRRGAAHDVVQQVVVRPGTNEALVPMAAQALSLNDSLIPMVYPHKAVWRQTAPGQFEAVVVDASGQRVATIRRHYRLEPGRFDLTLDQRIENLSPEPIRVAWHQYGPVSLPRGRIAYGGDVRRLRFGYLLGPRTDPSQQFVDATRFLTPHHDVLGSPLDGARTQWPERVLWPNDASRSDSLSLVWTATTNRYFAAAIFPAAVPVLGAGPGGPMYDKRFQLVGTLRRYVINAGLTPRGEPDDAFVLALSSPPMTLQPGQAADVSHGIYAGPLSKAIITRAPASAGTGAASMPRILGLDGLVIYTFGGPCGFCTFQWLTGLLRAFLGTLHDYVLFDWSLAIIVLVFCVRLLLHPITKRSQVSMLRFGKQMQAIAPKQRALQEKYRNDPAKLREETARLMREENINYGQALGCLPMFFQTPIWIALFAMLYFTYELRHQPAFFGLFQALTGGHWGFLADLAEPDHFVPFGASFHVPLISGLMGPIESINLLPILLGILFYVQQKYLTPAPSAPLTPEQESQQKIMRFMTVVMFPLFMYNMPSGLTLYTMTNSILGILESRYIRAHAERLDALRAERLKQTGGKAPPTFMQRLQARVQERQKAMAQARALQERRRGAR